MEEQACFINTPSLSLSCHHPSEQQDSLTYELRGSVSLGRFMDESESLSWEKWSSFSRNRYVEEAERYSRPGSVAQKKAYFEAHFKRMAALKAAALLEQASIHGPVLRHAGLLKSDSQMGVIVHQPRIIREGEQRGNNEVVSIAVEDQSTAVNGVKDVSSAEEVVSPDRLLIVEKFHGIIQPVGSISRHRGSVSSSNQTFNLNQDSSMKMTKNNSSPSSCVPPVDTEGQSPHPSVVVRIRRPGKENFSTPMGKQNHCKGDDPDKKPTPLRMSINRELNKLISPVIKKIAGSSKLSSRDSCSTHLKTPAKASEEDIGPNPVSETPISGKKRMLFRSSVSRSKPVVPRWHVLSVSEGGVQSPNASSNKTSSPIIPTSFCLRTGEREGRKKVNLEQKFNAKETTQKFKEKAEAELTKLRGSFCFKGEPAASNLYAPASAPKSPLEKLYKNVKMPSNSKMKTNECLPPRSVRPEPNGRGGKQVKQKRG